MQNYNFKLDDFCTVKGRSGLIITFFEKFPEQYIKDKSLTNISKEKVKSILKKPFYLSKKLDIEIKYKNSDYFFTIPAGYDWNGANVPPCFWLLIGQQKEPRFKLPSCVHDYICENKNVINHNRYLSSLVFEALCEYFGRFNKVKRWAMFHSVDNFQKIQKGWKKLH